MKVRTVSVQEGRKRTAVIAKKLVRLVGAVVDAKARGMRKSCEGKLAGLGRGSKEAERKWAEEVCRQRDFYETLLEAQSDVGEVLRGRYATQNLPFCDVSGNSGHDLKECREVLFLTLLCLAGNDSDHRPSKK